MSRISRSFPGPVLAQGPSPRRIPTRKHFHTASASHLTPVSTNTYDANRNMRLCALCAYVIPPRPWPLEPASCLLAPEPFHQVVKDHPPTARGGMAIVPQCIDAPARRFIAPKIPRPPIFLPNSSPARLPP